MRTVRTKMTPAGEIQLIFILYNNGMHKYLAISNIFVRVPYEPR